MVDCVVQRLGSRSMVLVPLSTLCPRLLCFAGDPWMLPVGLLVLQRLAACMPCGTVPERGAIWYPVGEESMVDVGQMIAVKTAREKTAMPRMALFFAGSGLGRWRSCVRGDDLFFTMVLGVCWCFYNLRCQERVV